MILHTKTSNKIYTSYLDQMIISCLSPMKIICSNLDFFLLCSHK